MGRYRDQGVEGFRIFFLEQDLGNIGRMRLKIAEFFIERGNNRQGFLTCIIF